MSFIGGYQSDIIGTGTNETGLWRDKHFIDCSSNPNYPSGTIGHAYIVSVAGKIGGVDGKNVGVNDVIYCNETNSGGSEAVAGKDWTILQANLEHASELVAGYMPIASPNEVLLGTNDTKAITSLKLRTLLNTLLAFQNGPLAGSIVPLAGTGNSVEGIYSAIIGGQNNAASGPYSAASGSFASAALFNEWARASGAFFNVKGSSQLSILNLMGTIPPDAVSVALSADGISTGDNRWYIPDNSIQQFSIQLTITRNSGLAGTAGHAYTAFYEGCVRNQASSISWVGAPPTVRDTHHDPGFAPAVSFQFSVREVKISIEALVEQTMHASATLFITQTKFSLA